jgi:hypothetical protein
MLDRLIRREKRSVVAIMAAAFAGFFLVMVALVFGSANDSDAALCLFSCFAGLLVPAIVVITSIFRDRYAQDLTENRLNLLLSPYGNLQVVIRQIDSEIESESTRQIRGSRPNLFRGKRNRCAMITDSWLLVFEPWEFWIVSVADILWAFKRISVEPRWWVGDRLIYQVCCVLGADRIYCMQMPNESWANDILEVMIERRPEALFGDRGEWRDLAAMGRKAMRIEIARRRELWSALDEEGRGDWHMDRRDEAANFVRRVDPLAPKDGGVQLPPE